MRVPTKVPVPKSTHTRTPRHTLVAPPQDVRAPQDQAQDSAGAAPKGDEAVGANPWRRSRPPNTGTAAAGSGRVRKHLWLKEQTMQRCPRSSSLLARMRCLRARPRMRISSGSSHVNLAHDCRRAMPARRLPHQQLERVAPQASRCGSAAAPRRRRTKRTRRRPWVHRALGEEEGPKGDARNAKYFIGFLSKA